MLFKSNIGNIGHKRHNWHNWEQLGVHRFVLWLIVPLFRLLPNFSRFSVKCFFATTVKTTHVVLREVARSRVL